MRALAILDVGRVMGESESRWQFQADLEAAGPGVAGNHHRQRPLIEVQERAGLVPDRSFIFSTWLRGLWSGQHGERPRGLMRLSLGEMRRDDFFAMQHTRVERLLDRGSVRVLHPVNAPSVIAAWACVEGPDVVHYVHVPGEYRRQGFARRLLADRLLCTHLTLDGLRLKDALGLRYMPHLLDAEVGK